MLDNPVPGRAVVPIHDAMARATFHLLVRGAYEEADAAIATGTATRHRGVAGLRNDLDL